MMSGAIALSVVFVLVFFILLPVTVLAVVGYIVRDEERKADLRRWWEERTNDGS